MTIKRILLSLLILSALSASAQESSDSCYMYAYLHWSPTATKYVAKLELGPDKDLTDIVDKSGSKLSFKSFLNAVNYMSTQGWDIVTISPKNPNHDTFVLEQYALIKKKMSIADVAQYASPKSK